MYKITCPYCFETFDDTAVHFRSEYVSDENDNPLPDEYSDIEEFKANFRGSDEERQRIMREYEEWNFFREGEDKGWNGCLGYQGFWARFKDGNGTTEKNPEDDVLGVKAYHRRIINPYNPMHNKYLIYQGNDFFIRDSQGMVYQIVLKNGQKCHRRVCPHCHNPLPNQYGLSSVKFITVVGITGAGKTVYISQLLKGMQQYVTKVGMSARRTTPSPRIYIEANKIAAGEPVPASTPAGDFQQPLFYDIVSENPRNRNEKITETFVIYDIAGELFKDQYKESLPVFAEFITKADGIILLIDPSQFQSIINSGSTNNDEKVTPSSALNAIHELINPDTTIKSRVPIAVCISKIDMEEVQEVLDDNLKNLLVESVEGIEGRDGFCMPVFKAVSHNPIAKGLHNFIKAEDMDLAMTLHRNYLHYSFFAFTALGCNTSEVKKEIDGKEVVYSVPIGPVLPKRIEEPLFWLFKNFGYITSDVRCYLEPVKCPVCHSQNVHELPEEQQTIVEKVGLFKKVERKVNFCCENPGCQYKWWQDN